MLTNKQTNPHEQDNFNIGDLVLFVGYELDFSPLANKIGIVIDQIPSTFDRFYPRDGSCEVLWLYSGKKMMVAMKHLQPAYILKDKSQTSE